MDLRTQQSIDAFLVRRGGVATRAQLLGRGAITRHDLDNLVKRGELVAVAPATYCRPWNAKLPAVVECAEVAHIGRCGLSHVSALRRRGLLDSWGTPVHITVSDTRMPRHRPNLVVHRVSRFPPVSLVTGVPTVALPHALATSWPLLAGRDQRAPVITAAREGLVRPGELVRVLESLRRLPGRRELMKLALLLDAGCESELEIWGHSGVFRGREFRHGVRQLPVVAGGRTYRLDLGFEPERVGVELDGAAFHGSRVQRERDLRRDSALSATGWVIMRFSHRRLHSEPGGCRREVLATLAARR